MIQPTDVVPVDVAGGDLPEPHAEARQRWRLVFRRSAGESSLAGRDLIAAWEAGLALSGLPIAEVEGPRRRPRLAFGAPLPAAMAAEAELAEIWLIERLPAWQVREALEPALPSGHVLVDLEDVWLGAPALVGCVEAADYLVTLAGRATPDAVAAAATRLLAAGSLPRTRVKSGGDRAYDLRPLLESIDVEGGGPPVQVRLRARFDPTLGTGRPDEVVAALSDELGTPLEIAAIVRERLLLRGDAPG